MGAATAWVVWTSLAMGGATGQDGSALLGSAGVYRPVASWVAIEGQGGIGGIGGTSDPETGGSLFHVAVGTRLGPQHTEVKPFLWLAFSHAHETPFDAIREDPSGTIFGESSAGVHHRGGVEAGLGVAMPLRLPGARGVLGDRLVTQLRVTAMHLPGTDEDDHRTYAYGEVSLGLRF